METNLSGTEAAVAVESRRPGRSVARNSFLTILLLIFLFLAFFFYNFQTVVVTGSSMFPELQDQQRILVCKAFWLVGPVGQEDTVVVRMGAPGEYIVKKVYRLGGETVDDVTLSPFDWDYYRYGKYKVPDDMVYLIGVNVEESEDSRSFGPIEISDVVGKVVRRN